MFNKGLIVVNGYKVWSPINHMCDRLIESFKYFNIGIDVKSTIEIYLSLNEMGDILTTDLPYDFIIYLDKDIYLARSLEKLGIRLFNKSTSIELCDDKAKTYIALSNSNIMMPKSVLCPLNYSDRIDELYLENISKTLGFPLVGKLNYGSQGSNVILINNFKELKSTESNWKNFPHHYEEFVQSSFGTDYRLITINHKCVEMMKRQNFNNDFRSNIAVGGTAIKTTLPSEFIETAEKISKLLDLDYCGIDLMCSKANKPILCEVNSNAFLQGIESVTGTDIAIKYAEHIYKTIYLS